jgi:hypothetical protein
VKELRYVGQKLILSVRETVILPSNPQNRDVPENSRREDSRTGPQNRDVPENSTE